MHAIAGFVGDLELCVVGKLRGFVWCGRFFLAVSWKLIVVTHFSEEVREGARSLRVMLLIRGVSGAFGGVDGAGGVWGSSSLLVLLLCTLCGAFELDFSGVVGRAGFCFFCESGMRTANGFTRREPSWRFTRASR